MFPFPYWYFLAPQSEVDGLKLENAELKAKVAGLQDDLAKSYGRPSLENFIYYAFNNGKHAYRVAGSREAVSELSKLLADKTSVPQPHYPDSTTYQAAINDLADRVAKLESAGHFPAERPATFEADYVLETPIGRQYLYGRESAVMALKARINGLTEKLAAAKAARDGK
jgi:hypothetical protein